MIKYVSLDSFVVCPDLIITEHINFHGQAFGRGLQVSDQKCHMFMDLGVSLEVSNNICPEYTDICLLSPVYQDGSVNVVFLIMSAYFALLVLDVISDQIIF